MTSYDTSNIANSFYAMASNIQVVAGQIEASINTAEFVDSRTAINLAPDQLIYIGDQALKASELLLIQRLLKEKYPEEYL